MIESFDILLDSVVTAAGVSFCRKLTSSECSEVAASAFILTPAGLLTAAAGLLTVELTKLSN
jgi:hypothetical protein